MMRSQPRKRKNITLLILLMLFCALCFTLQYQSYFADKLSVLKVEHVPTELLSYNKLGELFHRLGLISVIPNDSERYEQEYNLPENEEVGPFQKRRQISGTLLGLGEEHELKGKALEHLLGHKNRGTGAAISVVTEEENITGDRGILTHYYKHGRNWEKLSFVAMEKNKELLEHSAAGLRLHGGTSRDPSLPKHSYRLYFRKTYGQQWLDVEPLFEEEKALRTLVVHVDIPEDWPLNNVVANELYRMVGVPTLDYSQADFILNGKSHGLYWLSPHLSMKYVLERYGLEKIHYQRYRGEERNPVYSADFARLESAEFTPISFADANRVVDVEAMANYFIAVTFSGNTDWNQGVGFRDALEDTSRWQWIAWDLDHSFVDWYGSRSRNPDRGVWQQEGVGLVMDGRISRLKSKRQRIFRRLLVDDKEFSRWFVKRYIHVLNHQLHPKKLEQLYTKYEKRISLYNRQINPLLLQFFQNRHAHIRYEMQHYFKLPEFQRLIIEDSSLARVKIDGVVEELPFTGYYPKGTRVDLEIIAKTGEGAGYFSFNGKKHSGKSLSIQLERPSKVRWFPSPPE